VKHEADGALPICVYATLEAVGDGADGALDGDEDNTRLFGRASVVKTQILSTRGSGEGEDARWDMGANDFV
jgi:hypothetical protein